MIFLFYTYYELLYIVIGNQIFDMIGRFIAMKKYECTVCGYIYDQRLASDGGVEPGTAFERYSR